MRPSLLLLSLTACGPQPPWVSPAAPMTIQGSPQAPQFTCRPGWQTVDEFSLSTCTPFPDGLVACNGASRQQHGTRTCELLTLCADDGWPANLTDDTVFVRPGGSGSGTRDNPYGTLQQALLSDATTIALASGIHLGQHVITENRRIVGNCADETTLRSENGQPAVTLRGAVLELANVRLTSPDGTALLVESGELNAEALWVDDTTGVGLSLVGPNTSATLTRSLFTRVSPSIDGLRGYGLRNLDGASLTATDLTFRDVPGGLLVRANATLEEATFTNIDGRGITVFDEGNLTLNGAVFLDSYGSALVAINGTLEASDIYIRRIEWPTLEENGGDGIFASNGAQVVLNRADVRTVADEGLAVSESSVIGQDLFMDGPFSTWYGGGTLDIERLHMVITGSEEAVYLSDENMSVVLSNAVIERFDGAAAGDIPLLTVNSGTLSLENSHVIERGFAPEWVVIDRAGDITLRDVTLSGNGIGTAFSANATAPSSLVLERVMVSQAGQVFDMRDVDVTATDFVVENTQGVIGTLLGGTSTINRSDWEGADGGLSLSAADIELTDVSLSTTQGTGIELDEQSTLRGSRIRLHNIGSIGILSEGQVDLNNVQLDASDLEGDVGIHSVGEFADLTLSDYRITGFTTPILDEGARAILE